MEVDITDKGSKYFYKLFNKVLPINSSRKVDSPQLFDFIVLQHLGMHGQQDPLELIKHEEEEQEGDGEFTKSSIRRLFEAGYIEEV